MPILHHENRPWGYFDWIFDSRVLGLKEDAGQTGQGFIVKTLFVNPGARLSDQRHTGRSESWFVQSGTPTVYLERVGSVKEILQLKEGDMVDVPAQTWHRLSAENSMEPVRITEVWYGKVLDEFDIERRNDDYGRK